MSRLNLTIPQAIFRSDLDPAIRRFPKDTERARRIIPKDCLRDVRLKGERRQKKLPEVRPLQQPPAKRLVRFMGYSSFQTAFLFSRKAFSPSCASRLFMSLLR